MEFSIIDCEDIVLSLSLFFSSVDSMDEILFLAVDSMGVDSMGVVMATDPLEFAISVTFVSEK